MKNFFKKNKTIAKPPLTINYLLDINDFTIEENIIIDLIKELGPMDRKLIYWHLFDKYQSAYRFRRGSRSPVSSVFEISLDGLKNNHLVYDGKLGVFRLPSQSIDDFQNPKSQLDSLHKKHYPVFSKYEVDDYIN